MITIGFAEGEFRQSEGPNAQMEVTVARDQSVRLANPVIIRITPLSFGAVTFFPSSNNAGESMVPLLCIAFQLSFPAQIMTISMQLYSK